MCVVAFPETGEVFVEGTDALVEGTRSWLWLGIPHLSHLNYHECLRALFYVLTVQLQGGHQPCNLARLGNKECHRPRPFSYQEVHTRPGKVGEPTDPQG